MVKLSGGEALARSLVTEGVQVVFGIPGIQTYGIVAGLRDEPGIRLISTRHEQAATYMADGYARASGKPGVALVVPGVGLYNAASGLATAYARSSPVLVIVGQVPRGAIGKNVGAAHEVLDQADTVRSVTKWQRAVMRPREIPAAVTEAFRQMRSGRPRPVLIEAPPEVGVEREEMELWDPVPVSPIVPSPDQLREACRVITGARLPIIYAGGGVTRSDAEDALVRLAEATNIPVVTSSGGKGTIPDSHPLSYGSCFSPRGERQEMNQLFDVMQSANVVIGIGARFSLGNPAGNASTLVNINVDDAELMRIQSNTIPLHGDAKATIESDAPLPRRGRSRRAPIARRGRRGGPQPDRLLRHPLEGAAVRGARGDPSQHPRRCIHGLGRHAVRLLRPHALQGDPPEDVHRLRLSVQRRLLVPGGAGGEARPARPRSGLHGWGRRFPVQRVGTLHGRAARHQRDDRRLPQRLLRQRGARS